MTTIPRLLRKTYKIDFQCNRFLDSSYNRKLYNVKIIEKSNIGKKPIDKITKDDLNTFLASITHYSNSIIDKVYVTLKEGFAIAKSALSVALQSLYHSNCAVSYIFQST